MAKVARQKPTYISVIVVPAGAIAPLGTRPSAGTVTTKFETWSPRVKRKLPYRTDRGRYCKEGLVLDAKGPRAIWSWTQRSAICSTERNKYARLWDRQNHFCVQIPELAWRNTDFTLIDKIWYFIRKNCIVPLTHDTHSFERDNSCVY